MSKPIITTAENQFAAIQKKHSNALNEMDVTRQEKAENIARQRGLRLAKEAADKKIAEAAAKEKVASKKKKTSRKPVNS